jgi:hypothetical protein
LRGRREASKNKGRKAGRKKERKEQKNKGRKEERNRGGIGSNRSCSHKESIEGRKEDDMIERKKRGI